MKYKAIQERLACIVLRVPMTSDENLNSIIWHARILDIATEIMTHQKDFVNPKIGAAEALAAAVELMSAFMEEDAEPEHAD